MSEDLVNNEETEKTSNDIEDDEISWDDVEAELEQQRDMIKEDAQNLLPQPQTLRTLIL